ncbi:3-deoxy-manno-octulosonate cytidylyltransferase [candidate division GN15 bacterium]|nr:3-deoxy-manno-octulosonate cytidylyltransferase [candidate division GN15 bacterium]
MARGVIAVIPARMQSTRFPGKVAYRHRGKPLLFYVWNQVRQARTVDRVVVASDSPEVADLAASFGAEYVQTSAKHKTGSDRVAEVAEKLPGSIYINVQADNIGLRGRVFDPVVRWLKEHPREQYATLARKITDERDLDRTDCTKVVGSDDKYALWFSRLPIPYLRDGASGNRVKRHRFLEHIGVYFFRPAGLAAFASWKQAPAEKAESLEQLRILSNGGRIRLFTTTARSVSIDSPHDVNAMDALIR